MASLSSTRSAASPSPSARTDHYARPRSPAADPAAAAGAVVMPVPVVMVMAVGVIAMVDAPAVGSAIVDVRTRRTPARHRRRPQKHDGEGGGAEHPADATVESMKRHDNLPANADSALLAARNQPDAPAPVQWDAPRVALFHAIRCESTSSGWSQGHHAHVRSPRQTSRRARRPRRE